MKNTKLSKSHFHIGQRNVKTAIAATVCALIYLLFDDNPTFACIGAVFGIGNNMDSSKLNGGNRLFGTIIGGVIGILLFRFYIIFQPDGEMHFLILPLLFIGVILLILISQLVRWPGAIQPGGVMLCIILFNTPVATYLSYSINRIFDTSVGVMVALIINYLFPRERIQLIYDFVNSSLKIESK